MSILTKTDIGSEILKQTLEDIKQYLFGEVNSVEIEDDTLIVDVTKGRNNFISIPRELQKLFVETGIKNIKFTNNTLIRFNPIAKIRALKELNIYGNFLHLSDAHSINVKAKMMLRVENNAFLCKLESPTIEMRTYWKKFINTNKYNCNKLFLSDVGDCSGVSFCWDMSVNGINPIDTIINPIDTVKCYELKFWKPTYAHVILYKGTMPKIKENIKTTYNLPNEWKGVELCEAH